MNISYEPKKIIVTIDGADYEIAERTVEIDKKLQEHNEKIASMSSFAANYDLVEILLGADAAKKIFPNGDKENVTRSYVIARGVDDAYQAEYNEIREKEVEANMKKIDKFAERTKPVVELIDKTTSGRKNKR